MEENNFIITSSLDRPQKSQTSSFSFNSPLWVDLLTKSFGARILYLTVNEQYQLILPVMAAKGFHIGFMGFPILDLEGRLLLTDSFLQVLNKHTLPIKIDLLKVTVSAFCSHHISRKADQCIPETQISNFSTWNPDKLPKNTRRDIKHGANQNIVIKTGQQGSYDPAIYELYKKTVTRHKGAVKYPAAYFQALYSLSKNCDDIQFLTAFDQGQLVGFATFIRQQANAYYLHGAIDFQFKSKGISDVLVYEGLLWAKQKDVDKFNLMASPQDQAGLIRFKEKWGGETKMQHQYELVKRPVRAGLFKMARTLYGWMSPYIPQQKDG